MAFWRKNIFLLWLEWHFYDVLRDVLGGWKNFLLFGLNYFSVPMLLRTLIAPWRKYAWSYGRGFDIKRYLEAAISNLISRAIGMIVRIFLILVGLFAETAVLLAGIAVLFGWILLPFLLIGGFILGIKILL